MSGLLARCDRYLDAVAGRSADTVAVGPLRAFVSRAPWPYYVRPRPEVDLTAPDAVSAADVRAAADVLRAAGHAVSFEWIEEVVPCLGGVLRAEGGAVSSYPLLARELAGPPPAAVGGAARLLAADDPALRAALAVQAVGFDAPGTARGPAGPAERDARDEDPVLEPYVRERLERGESVIAVVDDPLDGVVASGWHNPVGAETEVVGVATLPTHRRRGAAAAVVDLLVADAAARGVTLALLSASDGDVARLYERVGFVRVGRSGAASLPEPG